MAPNQNKLTIDVVSDVVCPWCYIGKRNLETAMLDSPDIDCEVRWHPFQLDPSIPAGGLDRADYMAKKFGAERYAEISERIRAAGAGVGIAFAFERILRAPNTLDAHRLIRWAASVQQQSQVKEHLLRAYFVEGKDIGDRSVLTQIASAHGMDAALVATLLTDGTDCDMVREEIATAQRLGVSGVPFFVFAGKLGLSGAQPPTALRSAMEQALGAN